VELTDWLFVPLSTLTVVTILLLVVLGGTVVFPGNWESVLWQAARDEVERRFANLGPRSQNDLIAAARLVGPERELGESNEEAADLVLPSVLVLTDRSDREKVDEELTALRARLQDAALRRQARLVANVSSIRIASYVWRVCDWLNRCFFVVAGFVWFFPKSLPFLSKRLQKNSGVLAVIGVTAGIIWAALTRAMTPEGVSFDWLGLVGDVALIFALGGIVVAVLGLYKAVLVLRFGEPHQWTRRGVIFGISFLAFIVIVIGLGTSGLLAQWQRGAALWVQEIEITDDAARWVGGAAFAAFIVYFLRNCYRWVRMPGLSLGDRLRIVAAAPLVLLMLVLIVLSTIGVPTTGLAWLFTSTAWIFLILGGIASLTASFEWIQKYRALRDLGHRVPRKGFRWWALIAWAAIAVALTVMWPLLMTTDLRAATPALVVPLAALLDVAAAVWALAFFPGAIITVLYVRRVAKAYDVMRFSLAPTHPLLSSPGEPHPDTSPVSADQDNDLLGTEADDGPRSASR
jgi:hypothetical protein